MCMSHQSVCDHIGHLLCRHGGHYTAEQIGTATGRPRGRAWLWYTERNARASLSLQVKAIFGGLREGLEHRGA